MKLYYVSKTRSLRPRWMLEELGAPYELVRLDPSKGETRTPEHLARQPLGHVPVLEDGPVRMFESAAICLYLAEKYPEKGLLPPPATPGRATAYQWLFYAMTEIEPACIAIEAEMKKPAAERDAAALDRARARLRKAVGPLEPILAGAPFLLGAGFSVADVVMGSVVSWGRAMGGLDGLPAVEAWLGRLRERPARRRALAD